MRTMILTCLPTLLVATAARAIAQTAQPILKAGGHDAQPMPSSTYSNVPISMGLPAILPAPAS
ncbi:hypothetical protein [Sandarakinorhabdus sp. AAP62]|uniref:hypothetical protein n=1 Tax=Sandarakinorhabdus sp. AAP62 TaxID=1248916 RepID=UPI0002E37121|nr:hypothetical protein [Sandarakinorhabdus sp. AAP62]